MCDLCILCNHAVQIARVVRIPVVSEFYGRQHHALPVARKKRSYYHRKILRIIHIQKRAQIRIEPAQRLGWHKNRPLQEGYR